jgi:hypothetical protein
MDDVARGGQHAGEWGGGPSSAAVEDSFTRSLEQYTAPVPSSAYLAVALGAMGLSLLFQVTGRGKWGNFVAQWVPTWILFGVYNKLVKLEARDGAETGEGSTGARAVGISNRPLDEERQRQARVPPRGSSSGSVGRDDALEA